MIKFPPYLKKGDTIGLVAPSGFMPIENMQACIETLDAWGYSVHMGATTHSQSQNYFSATDDERLHDLQAMLDDPDIHAILCARGGYGLSRIIDGLHFGRFKKHSKWIVGFSDITLLHAHLFSRHKIASLHAPMASAFKDGGAENMYIASLKAALEGSEARYNCASHLFNRIGECSGRLVGGNLSLLAHLCGTRSAYKTKSRILFIEDVGEYLYNIDRMLIQLKRNGMFDDLAGLIVGSFSDVKDTQRPFGKNVYEIIRQHVEDYSYPVCYGFPVSHEKENYALKIGGMYSLAVDADVRLYEQRGDFI